MCLPAFKKLKPNENYTTTNQMINIQQPIKSPNIAVVSLEQKEIPAYEGPTLKNIAPTKISNKVNFIEKNKQRIRDLSIQ